MASNVSLFLLKAIVNISKPKQTGFVKVRIFYNGTFPMTKCVCFNVWMVGTCNTITTYCIHVVLINISDMLRDLVQIWENAALNYHFLELKNLYCIMLCMGHSLGTRGLVSQCSGNCSTCFCEDEIHHTMK